MLLKGHVYTTCQNVSMCINGGTMAIYVPCMTSLLSTIFLGAMHIDDYDANNDASAQLH